MHNDIMRSSRVEAGERGLIPVVVIEVDIRRPQPIRVHHSAARLLDDRLPQRGARESFERLVRKGENATICPCALADGLALRELVVHRAARDDSSAGTVVGAIGRDASASIREVLVRLLDLIGRKAPVLPPLALHGLTVQAHRRPCSLVPALHWRQDWRQRAIHAYAHITHIVLLALARDAHGRSAPVRRGDSARGTGTGRGELRKTVLAGDRALFRIVVGAGRPTLAVGIVPVTATPLS
jgi:hypothetical protein